MEYQEGGCGGWQAVQSESRVGFQTLKVVLVNKNSVFEC